MHFAKSATLLVMFVMPGVCEGGRVSPFCSDAETIGLLQIFLHLRRLVVGICQPGSIHMAALLTCLSS